MKTGLVAFAIAALAGTLSFVSPAAALPITKQLKVNVYELCNEAQTACAGTGFSGNSFFASETNDIWAQAGIIVSFNYVKKLYYDDVLEFDSDGFHGLSTLQQASEWYEPKSVSLFLVNTIDRSPTSVTFGVADSATLVVAMADVMSFNGGLGRVDTIAHELGHNLGLVPVELGGDVGGHSANSWELMAAGSNRCIPGTGCLAPAGYRLDSLTPQQITLATSSAFLTDVAPVPEPGEWAMMLAGLGVIGLVAQRRRAA